MRRASLILCVLASVVAGGACWAHASPAHADAPAPPVPSPTRAIDEYGDITFDDEKARLDNLAIEAQNDPRAKAHITCYGGRVGRRGEAARRCARAKGYLSGHRGITAERIMTVDGGYREELTVVLWAIPPGVTPPQPSPTVDPSEVRFIKGKPKRGARRGRVR